MRLSIAAKALALATLFTGAFATAEPSGNSFVVTSARVFDGERVLAAATVVVRDGIVVSVAADGEVPPGLPAIDADGSTLLPGFIDSHVHTFPGAAADALRFGVTTLLDMYHLGGAESARAFRAQRESLATVTEADIYSSLAGVTPPGGHPSQMAGDLEIPTLGPDDDANEHIASLAADGADYIKIMQDDSQLGDIRLVKFASEQLAQIIAAAHAHDLVAVVHVSAHDEAAVAFTHGADMIAHVFQDRIADDALVQLAGERDAAVITTLSVLARASGTDHAARLVAHPEIGPRLSDAQRQSLTATFGRTREEIIEHAIGSVRRFHAAGVAVLAGTDAPNPGTAHGVSIHQELELLVEAGLTPVAALGAATSLPAQRFGLADRGRIAPGYRADMLLVRGDPTRDVTATRDIVRIWKNGYAVDRTPPAPRQ